MTRADQILAILADGKAHTRLEFATILAAYYQDACKQAKKWLDPGAADDCYTYRFGWDCAIGKTLRDMVRRKQIKRIGHGRYVLPGVKGLTMEERNRLIVKRRREGATFAQVGREVGLSYHTVRYHYYRLT